jgi:hypothetical protein
MLLARKARVQRQADNSMCSSDLSIAIVRAGRWHAREELCFECAGIGVLRSTKMSSAAEQPVWWKKLFSPKAPAKAKRWHGIDGTVLELVCL